MVSGRQERNGFSRIFLIFRVQVDTNTFLLCLLNNFLLVQYIEFLFQFSIILFKGHLVLDNSFFHIDASELLFFTINSKTFKMRLSNGWHFSFLCVRKKSSLYLASALL